MLHRSKKHFVRSGGIPSGVYPSDGYPSGGSPRGGSPYSSESPSVGISPPLPKDVYYVSFYTKRNGLTPQPSRMSALESRGQTPKGGWD